MASGTVRQSQYNLTGEVKGAALPHVVVNCCPAGLEAAKLQMHSCPREKEMQAAKHTQHREREREVTC